MNRRPPSTQAIAVFAEHCLPTPSDADLRQCLVAKQRAEQAERRLWEAAPPQGFHLGPPPPPGG